MKSSEAVIVHLLSLQKWISSEGFFFFFFCLVVVSTDSSKFTYSYPSKPSRSQWSYTAR